MDTLDGGGGGGGVGCDGTKPIITTLLRIWVLFGRSVFDFAFRCWCDGFREFNLCVVMFICVCMYLFIYFYEEKKWEEEEGSVEGVFVVCFICLLFFSLGCDRVTLGIFRKELIG